MPTVDNLPESRSTKRRSGGFLAVCLAMALAGCQFNSVEDALFAPTYNPLYVPQTYGTQYDCKAYKAAGNTTGWKGIVGGRVTDGGLTRVPSRVGCFKTQAECQAFVSYMTGYYTRVRYAACQPL